MPKTTHINLRREVLYASCLRYPDGHAEVVIRRPGRTDIVLHFQSADLAKTVAGAMEAEIDRRAAEQAGG